MDKDCLIVIPARYGSQRFPGKVLAQIAGKTMLQHVYERASRSTYLTSTLIATDDERVYAADCLHAGAKGYLMKDHAPEKLLLAIRHVLRGGIYRSETLSQKVA